MNINRNSTMKRNSPSLTSNGYSKYRFPVYDEVPSGQYFSKVKSAEYTTTKAGKPAIEVRYIMKDFNTCYKIYKGFVPENEKNPPFYIKQRYPQNTQYYEAFVDSMSEALEKESFALNEVIGVTEYVVLSYDKSDIGGFSERYPFDEEDFECINNN